MTLTQVQIDYLKDLADANGWVAPQLVVDEARDPDNCLHDLFDWNVQAAAAKHWLTQAGQIVKLVRFEFKVTRRTLVVPFYISDPAAKPKSKHFIKTELVRADFARKRATMLAEIARIQAAIRRALTLATYFDLVAEFEGLLEDAITLETEAASATTAGPPPPPPRSPPRGRGKRSARGPSPGQRSARSRTTAPRSKARRKSS
jgi:hypothetical protein